MTGGPTVNLNAGRSKAIQKPAAPGGGHAQAESPSLYTVLDGAPDLVIARSHAALHPPRRKEAAGDDETEST